MTYVAGGNQCVSCHHRPLTEALPAGFSQAQWLLGASAVTEAGLELVLVEGASPHRQSHGCSQTADAPVRQPFCDLIAFPRPCELTLVAGMESHGEQVFNLPGWAVTTSLRGSAC